jgi:hypothetical protein
MVFTPVVAATQGAELMIKPSLGKKLSRFHLSKKAGCGGVCLWFWIYRRHRKSDHGPRLAVSMRAYLKNY